MKQKTFDLYRVSAAVWKDLPYWKALQVKEGSALAAMSYYRKKDDVPGSDFWLNKYMASEKAVKFNRDLQEELDE